MKNDPARTGLARPEVEARLLGKTGREYWRSLDELAKDPGFDEFLHREFPREAAVWSESFSRRSLLKVMGAGLALAGLSGCVQEPEEKIVPRLKFTRPVSIFGYSFSNRLGLRVKTEVTKP